jgi:hypothetical protein
VGEEERDVSLGELIEEGEVGEQKVR